MIEWELTALYIYKKIGLNLDEELWYCKVIKLIKSVLMGR
jgi:hypothetical protein